MDTQLGKDLALLSANKTAIKNAIEAKGVTVGAAKLSEYAAKIAAIEGGGGSTPPTDDWTPNPTWFDIESIVSNDVQAGYTYKMIQLLPDNEISSSFTGGAAYKTSDGSFYNAATATHTWNTASDQQCVENGVNVYKTRWVITYFTSRDLSLTSSTDISSNVLYVIFVGVHFYGLFIYNKPLLQGFNFLSGAAILVPTMYQFFMNCTSLRYVPYFDVSSVSNFSFMFSGCKALRVIPEFITTSGTDFSYMFKECVGLLAVPSLNTSNGTTFEGMFYYCAVLEIIPLLNTSKGTNFSLMFYSCSALKEIPLLDTSLGTNFSSMFQYCVNLQTIPLLNTSKGTNFSSMFSSCQSLKEIPLLDTSKGTTFNYMFMSCISLITIPPINTALVPSFYYFLSGCSSLLSIPQLDATTIASTTYGFNGCTSLVFIKGFTNLSKTLSLSECTRLSHDSLMNVINNLKDLTGFTAQTLTLGSTNLAKLSAAEKAVATNKNWTLA